MTTNTTRKEQIKNHKENYKSKIKVNAHKVILCIVLLIMFLTAQKHVGCIVDIVVITLDFVQYLALISSPAMF